MGRVHGTEAGAARAASAVLLAALIVGALVAGATAAAATAGAADADDSDASATTAAQGTTVAQVTTATEDAGLAQEVDADRTRIRIALQPDGDGRWTVELWTRLADDADEAAFASVEADVRNDSESFTTDFRERMNGSVAAASDATGREMAIENVTASTRTEGVPSRYGVLAYEFEWTAFAAVDGDRLVAGDAIDGFLLEETTRLTIEWPEGYRPTDVEPAPDDETDAAVVWQGGETDFVAGQPRVVVTSAPAEDDPLLPVVAVVVAVLTILLALAWLVRSGRLELPGVFGGSTQRSHEDASDPATGTTAGAGGAAAAPQYDGDATAGAESTADDVGGQEDGGTVDADSGAGDAGDQGDDGDDVPPKLLSNEEQVLRLLEDHGGRMKQQQVVSELDWTEAKTSQVVTGMREEERIEVFRIGRENVLALPGEADL